MRIFGEHSHIDDPRLQWLDFFLVGLNGKESTFAEILWQLFGKALGPWDPVILELRTLMFQADFRESWRSKGVFKMYFFFRIYCGDFWSKAGFQMFPVDFPLIQAMLESNSNASSFSTASLQGT